MSTKQSNDIKPQRIIMPWHTKRWQGICSKITEKMNSIIDLDTVLTTLSVGKIRPRRFSELFNTYSIDEQYASCRISSNDMVERIIPCMQQLIAGAAKTFKAFDARILSREETVLTTNIVLTRLQVATLITCMWFGVFDYDYITKGKHTIDDLPVPAFIYNIVTGNNIFALQCLLTYFDTVSRYVNHVDPSIRGQFKKGIIVLKRQRILETSSRAVSTSTEGYDMRCPVDWLTSDAPVCDIQIGTDMYIDRQPARILMAFAREYIGGEMFMQSSLTQEEIMLLIFPECLVSTLFCAVLDPHSSLVVLGAEKISSYYGYGSSVKFTGRHVDDAQCGMNDSETMIQRAIIFVDASSRTSVKSQFIDDFTRDLDKLYSGYSLAFAQPGEPIVGGNWSYGFNGSNMQVKLLQQILAASQAGKSLIYCPVGMITERLQEYLFYLRNDDYEFTVGSIVRAYLKVIEDNYTGPSSRLHDMDLISHVIQQILF